MTAAPARAPVAVTQHHTALTIYSPYDPQFVSGVKALGGRWDPEARSWSVPLHERDRLRELLLRAYGTDAGLPAPTAAPGAPSAPPPRRPGEVIAAALRELNRLEALITPAT